MNQPPKQYLQGFAEFYKLKLKLTPDVLIPRPETELLVDEVLKSIKYDVLSSKVEEKNILVIDIGTGSGNIAISIAKNAPGVKVFATDISSRALKVAQKNAKLHGVENQIKFIQSNLLANYPLQPACRQAGPTTYNLIIITNLPYIPSERIPYLDPSVKNYEPNIALDGGKDGFELYRKLFKQIKKANINPKLIVGEIDYTHGELAISESLKYFPKAQVEVKTDLAKKQRVLLICY
ncbi:peptide chain release factor N(5)-glutamine methyltransferase [Candidatus Daviesbacteria bacterium]|nr:peptide chain release factor N(5)-glutamine methyltransferase [Candidatus Daviesbacteria bacterium]